MPDPIEGQLYPFDQLVEEVLYRFGNRQRINERVKGWVNSSILQFATSEIPIPELETSKTVDITSGAQEYNIQDDFALYPMIGIRSIKYLGTGWRLKRWPFWQYRRLVQQSPGPPARWTRNGLIIALDPIPDDDSQLLIDYRKMPELDANPLANQWHEWLIVYSTFIGWNALGEISLAQSQFKVLPLWLQTRLMSPLTPDEWEAYWDPDAGLELDTGWGT